MVDIDNIGDLGQLSIPSLIILEANNKVSRRVGRAVGNGGIREEADFKCEDSLPGSGLD
jgi:hypothetical protein